MSTQIKANGKGPERTELSRRTVLAGTAAVTFGAAAAAEGIGSNPALARGAGKDSEGGVAMSSVTTEDGVQIFYKDWGHGQPIVFHHGWPLSSDDWDTQMLFFVQHGYRVVGIDRPRPRTIEPGLRRPRHDHYAADAAAVVEHLDLRNTIHIGHSTGGGEAARFVARYGKGRVANCAGLRAN